MQLIRKYNKGKRLLLFVIDQLINMLVSLKDKKGVTIVNAFQKILDDLKRKSSKIWVDQVL